jgi:hypothetical protein
MIHSFGDKHLGGHDSPFVKEQIKVTIFRTENENLLFHRLVSSSNLSGIYLTALK